MEVTFKIAKEKDVEEIIKLCNECFMENTSLEYAKEMFRKTMDDPNSIYLIGVVENKIVSHAKITIIETIYEKMNTYAILNHVCVKRELRRHNIATKMLDEISKICRERGVKKLVLWSKNVRVAAHSCYKKYGFQIDESSFFEKELKGVVESENR